jgi:hypothetical protein
MHCVKNNCLVVPTLKGQQRKTFCLVFWYISSTRNPNLDAKMISIFVRNVGVSAVVETAPGQFPL